MDGITGQSSQGEIRVESFGNIKKYDYFYPINYQHYNCGFDVIVDENNVFYSILFKEAFDCNLKSYWFVIDGYKYPIAGDFTVKLHRNTVETTSFINFGSCARISGNPITVPDGYYYNALLYTNSFAVKSGSSIDYIVNEDEVYFRFITYDEDIVCENGINTDIIFKEGFE